MMAETPEGQARQPSNITDRTAAWIANIKNLIKRPTSGLQQLRIVVNPAAGQDEPAFAIFNQVFGETELDWDIVLTKDEGDGQQLALQALADGVDIVAAYGGDGTVMEVACGMRGSKIPMAILPGGTGNNLSIELGIPRDLGTACRLIVSPDRATRAIDMGLINDHCFLLRAGAGLEATMIEGAPRPAKDRYGIFAYIIAGIQAVREPQKSLYHLVLDGEAYDAEGLGCVIANAGNIGVPGISLSPDIAVDDGFLDVIIIRKADLPSLVSVAASILGGSENTEKLIHWKAKYISVFADPPQTVQADGEIIGSTPILAKLIPSAVNLIVPPTPDLSPERSSDPQQSVE
jgi:YegS/Rv2252/BmrU family lipid kinase